MRLKSGQINFEYPDNPGIYQCVVIKDGEIHNLTDRLREILLDKLQRPSVKEINLNDMF